MPDAYFLEICMKGFNDFLESQYCEYIQPLEIPWMYYFVYIFAIYNTLFPLYSIYFLWSQ